MNANTGSVADIELNQEGAFWACRGAWTTVNAQNLTDKWQASLKKSADRVVIDMSEVDRLDSVGALILARLVHELSAIHKEVDVQGLSQTRKDLLHLVSREMVYGDQIPPLPKPIPFFENLGRNIFLKWRHTCELLSFIGELCLCLVRVFTSRRRFQFKAVLREIELMGFNAMPIIGLMSFLIGIVMGYQTGVQLQQYGGDFLIVNLVGIVVFREFGPLITAVIIAGRTSTAFTAEIGTMIINEEVDALKTMGIVPIERLVIPKLLGLMIAMPLLVVWADIFGVLGGFCVSWSMLHMTIYTFFTRFQDVMSVSDFMVGLVKVPVFALVVVLVGCYQGFEVGDNAGNVGLRTTRSAVQSLFLIIVVDAMFSVLFTLMGV